MTIFTRATALLLMAACTLQVQANATTRPNILLIVADDLGYTDIGSYGGEIATPTLDRLAAEGIRLNNFHVLPSCAPTRSVLLTGSDNHIAGIGGQIITGKQRGQPGYEGYLSPSIPTLAEVLSKAGYNTYLSGKWHLGAETGQRPFDRGFERTFSLLSGGASHFADAAALGSEEPVLYSRNGQLVKHLPDDFYSTRTYTNEMLNYLESNRGSGKPFFAYLAYTAPHDPLHAPEEYIARYKGTYDEGYEILREQRHLKAHQEGVLPAKLKLGDWPSVVKRWDSLPEDDKAKRRRDMETYAAMVDYMDEQIGRVVQWLDENDQLDKTLILFFSDNGANALSATVYPGHDASYHAQFDNSLDNRGRRGSFTEMGAGWATASSAGLRLFKVFSTEGGIRTPAIIRPPGGATGEISHAFIHVQDVMPSLLGLAGVPHPSVGNEQIPAMTGRSQLPLFNGDDTHVSEAQGVGYELHGTRAYFSGKWKILQMPVPMGSGTWELFDLEADPAESIDLAKQRPDVLATLVRQHQAYEEEVGVVYDLAGPMATMTMLSKGIMGSLLLLGLLSLWTVRRGSGAIAIALAMAQTAGAIFLATGLMQGTAVLLLIAGATGLLWHSFNRKHWYVGSISVLIVLLVAVLMYLRSGRAVAMMLG